MPKVERDIVVDAPLATVYNQWTQFEEFPRFMDGVQEVRQVDDRHLWWRVEVAGRIDEWEAEIEEQTPDERIAWRSTAGRDVGGIVTFEPAGEDRTRVHLDMTFETKTWAEDIGEEMGLVASQVEGDLERFKEFIESRGHETGAWRGEIHEGRETASSEGRSGARRDTEPGEGLEATRRTHEDAARREAELRQQAPGGGAPGGQADIDPTTGEVRRT